VTPPQHFRGGALPKWVRHAAKSQPGPIVDVHRAALHALDPGVEDAALRIRFPHRFEAVDPRKAPDGRPYRTTPRPFTPRPDARAVTAAVTRDDPRAVVDTPVQVITGRSCYYCHQHIAFWEQAAPVPHSVSGLRAARRHEACQSHEEAP
jgi:hypothetical protein